MKCIKTLQKVNKEHKKVLAWTKIAAFANKRADKHMERANQLLDKFNDESMFEFNSEEFKRKGA